ncbi:arsenate reductase ArsC [Henriciella marina]|uniref:arsenate reductase ArsC n=1 Tax=Henriciella marina TaxID=453851 RepID=UPI0003692BD4|nr:arsenate reductase ArsC [Henriciella marina]
MKNHNILILCTGNSARSIIGEVLVSAMPGFKGYSAGSSPRGEPHPLALSVLSAKGHDTSGLTSKSWDVFAGDNAPKMDVIITVCDNAAGEVCPYWPGHPVQVHWGLSDPADVEEMSRQRIAFEDTYFSLKKRLQRVAALDFDAMNDAELKAEIQAIHTRR